MKAPSECIEIIVLTHNRAAFLKETLASLCRQSIGKIPITVLDNGSTDHTSQVVCEFKEFGVRVNRSDRNLGAAENFARAKELAQREWVMVFHDDDLLHPDYISTALALAEKYRNAVLIGSGMSFEERPSSRNWPRFKGEHVHCPAAKDFAALLYDGFPFHFGSTVYLSEFFKAVPIKWEVYGKVADRPFLLDIAGQGSVIVLKEAYVKYRCHTGQDSTESSSGPFPEQLFALHKAYLQLLGSDPLSRYGRIFIRHNYAYLAREYSRLPKSGMSLEDYLNRALMNGASTKEAIEAGVGI